MIVNSAPDVAPEALRVTTSVVEGDIATITGSFSDSDLQPGHVILVDFGDGSSPVTASVNTTNRTFQASYRYRDDGISRTPVDVYRIAVTVTDPAGATASSSLGSLVTEVRNIAPLVQSIDVNKSTVWESEAVTLSGTFLDVGLLDTHTVTIDWKDGSQPELLALPLGREEFFGHLTSFPGPL